MQESKQEVMNVVSLAKKCNQFPKSVLVVSLGE